jgi:hypothetical protein
MKQILFLFFTSVCIFSVKGQTTLKAIDCQTLEVGLKEEVKGSAIAILEQQLQENVWMKVMEKQTEKYFTTFDNLKPGIYRSTFVNSGSNWESKNNISNIIKLECNEETTSPFDFLISPNPALNKITISLKDNIKGGDLLYEVFDNLGNTIVKGKEAKSNFSLELKELKNGVYYVKIDFDGNYKTKQFIISK